MLADTKQAMNAKELIEAMAAKKLWTSPGGKTPHATLYSAILREINTKGNDARFKKTERGKFAANALMPATGFRPTPHVRHRGAFSRWWASWPTGSPAATRRKRRGGVPNLPTPLDLCQK